ncbi:hypothetical protein FNSP4_09420 [Fusobacterium nucleatum]|nr:hypothetical protein FNCP4_03470 [Fusobacterium nucleatum]BEP03208.1 hypothetical protein FNSP4_09420 [Fusobacterium nucleatum]
MEKEKVLEIEYQEVFDRVAIRIKYQNFEVLKRGEFEDRGIGVVSFNNPCYLPSPYNQLHLKGKSKIEDNSIFTVAKEEFKNIKNMVEAINEKYGIPKRWRAEKEKEYFFITGTSEITTDEEYYSEADDGRYELGNYFKTKEEAQKVIDSKEWQDLWAKVRAGEIGGDE